MPSKKKRDPTEAIREAAAAFSEVDEGTSCNQSSFKAGKSAFLFVGPGRGGKGYKAMFKLEASRPQAELLAREAPERFEVGSGTWVTTRFTDDDPLPKRIWSRWLKESYDLTVGGSGAPKQGQAGKKPPKKPATKKKTARKKAAAAKKQPAAGKKSAGR